ncbi:MAG: hypothetical protein PWP05_495, partial [Thermovirga sp.]|jgi:hypothetical protein|nr:hypothetical protein [Thermovirga sp.]
VQGGKPKDTENYSLVKSQEIKLWIQKGLKYEGEALYIDKVPTTLGYLLLGTNVIVDC